MPIGHVDRPLYFTHPVVASAELRLQILSWIPDVELLCAAATRMLGPRSRYLIGV